MNLTLAIQDGMDGDKTALHFRGRDYTYRELMEGAERAARGLQSRGLGGGDRVALYLPSSLELITTFFGAFLAGCAVVPMNTGYREEIAHILRDSEARALITDETLVGWAREVGSEIPSLREIITVGEDYEAMLAEGRGDTPLSPAGEEDTAVICYTSGTTGRSKGARISHRNILSNLEALHSTWEWVPEDRLVLGLPLFHVHGLIVALSGSLVRGCTVFLHEKFDSHKVLTSIGENSATLFMGVPAMYGEFLKVEDPGAFELGSMRLFISGSAPLPTTVFSAFRDRFGFKILERYGTTETIMNTSNPCSGQRKPGSVGRPLPGVEVRIDRGKAGGGSRGTEEAGEILVRGPNVFQGYLNLPEVTSASFEGEWFRTGDLGRFDEDGYLTISGRAKELIISGGYNIYPREVEEVLASHPAVREAAVVGMPDEKFGEGVLAAVVLSGQGTPEDGPGEEELIAYCTSRLASYKKPRRVIFLDALPRNAMGKVDKLKIALPDS